MVRHGRELRAGVTHAHSGSHRHLSHGGQRSANLARDPRRQRAVDDDFRT